MHVLAFLHSKNTWASINRKYQQLIWGLCPIDMPVLRLNIVAVEISSWNDGAVCKTLVRHEQSLSYACSVWKAQADCLRIIFVKPSHLHRFVAEPFLLHTVTDTSITCASQSVHKPTLFNVCRASARQFMILYSSYTRIVILYTCIGAKGKQIELNIYPKTFFVCASSEGSEADPGFLDRGFKGPVSIRPILWPLRISFKLCVS